jgi:hypothetical protein
MAPQAAFACPGVRKDVCVVGQNAEDTWVRQDRVGEIGSARWGGQSGVGKVGWARLLGRSMGSASGVGKI